MLRSLVGSEMCIRDSAILWPAGELLANEISLATSQSLELEVRNGSSVPANQISIAIDPGLDLDQSSLVVSTTGANLTGGSYHAVVTATMTLLQALHRGTDHDSIPPERCSAGDPAWRLPGITVQDRPEFGIRGVMVDAAREWLPLAALKQYVVLCRVYKLNHLHIHLTDDGAFTFPSTAFPELAAASPFRYTIAELAELQAFAAVRGVEIVGEMDVPGHGSGLTAALPGVFGFPSNPKLDVVNFVDPKVVAALQTILAEIQQVLPSKYMMIGADLSLIHI
eukprot:TRINITY_DN20511_c0_g1_i1.p1 TRINITY_DN20511_c0_g1~~TRINITY_DN20511_c0_g1_i1.p1  ORF type:complete len:296 (+),score=106.87 TRINITY_DN20511_c0_g1_i1:46-888(+)